VSSVALAEPASSDSADAERRIAWAPSSSRRHDGPALWRTCCASAPQLPVLRRSDHAPPATSYRRRRDTDRAGSAATAGHDHASLDSNLLATLGSYAHPPVTIFQTRPQMTGHAICRGDMSTPQKRRSTKGILESA
jgi:hypothetical protein